MDISTMTTGAVMGTCARCGGAISQVMTTVGGQNFHLVCYAQIEAEIVSSSGAANGVRLLITSDCELTHARAEIERLRAELDTSRQTIVELERRLERIRDLTETDRG